MSKELARYLCLSKQDEYQTRDSLSAQQIGMLRGMMMDAYLSLTAEEREQVREMELVSV